MLRSCHWCGKIHDSKLNCGKRPQRQYRRSQEESGRYTAAWNRKSDEIKERSHYLCSVCLADGVLTYDELETHHIVKLRDRPDLLLEDSNLICLCVKHHKMAERGKISADRLRGLAAKRDQGSPLSLGSERGGVCKT
ncbi:MAG: HNH endonuclease, partial [Clostridia bacterium]|nr:HNH endonuclease [Clostridia bacterium]